MACPLTRSSSAASFLLPLHLAIFELLWILSYVLPLYAGEKKLTESRVKELEDALATQAAELKKAAEAAEISSTAAEKMCMERLAFLAQNVRG